MFEDLKSAGKHFAIYGMGTVLNRIVGFILIPLYTHYLHPREYGTLELLELTTYVIAFLVGAGISQSVLRYYYDAKDPVGKNVVVSSALIADIVLSLTAMVVLWLSAPVFARYILDGPEQADLFQLVFLTMTFSIISEVPMAFIRAQQHSTLFTIVSVVRLALSLGLNLYFIIVLHMSIYGILLSSVITGGLAAATLTYYTLKRTGVRFSFPKLREMMHFGLPYVPAGLGLFVINFADRFFLKRFGTLDDVGVYSLGYKFGMILSPMLIEPFLAIWRPKVFELEGKDHAAKFYSLMLTYFTFLAVYGTLGISVSIGDVLTLLSGPEFHAAYKIVPIILVSYVLSGLYSQFQVGILLTKRTHLLAGIITVAAISNLALNVALIPPFGMWGAAFATLGTFAIMNVFGYFYSQRLFFVAYEWGRIMKIVAAAVVLYCLALLIRTDSVVLSMVLRLLIALTFPLILWVLRFYHPEEFVRAKEMARQVMRLAPKPH